MKLTVIIEDVSKHLNLIIYFYQFVIEVTVLLLLLSHHYCIFNVVWNFSINLFEVLFFFFFFLFALLFVYLVILLWSFGTDITRTSEWTTVLTFKLFYRELLYKFTHSFHMSGLIIQMHFCLKLSVWKTIILLIIVCILLFHFLFSFLLF